MTDAYVSVISMLYGIPQEKVSEFDKLLGENVEKELEYLDSYLDGRLAMHKFNNEGGEKCL